MVCYTGLDWIEQCFMSLPTQYRLYGSRFFQVKRPNQQYQSTEGTKSTQRNQTYNKQTQNTDWTVRLFAILSFNINQISFWLIHFKNHQKTLESYTAKPYSQYSLIKSINHRYNYTATLQHNCLG